MEIVEMIFSVQGATAGAIVLEWNVHESKQGSGKKPRTRFSLFSKFMVVCN
jgi:hypothetical protein